MEQRFFPAGHTHFFLPDIIPTQREETFEDDSQLLPLIQNALASKNKALLQEYLTHLFNKYKVSVNQSQIYVKFHFFKCANNAVSGTSSLCLCKLSSS